jgi:hypothetical protein
MSDDLRCCGSGTCIIDTEGRCWCGQRWDGDQLVGPASMCSAPASVTREDTPANAVSGSEHRTEL